MQSSCSTNCSQYYYLLLVLITGNLLSIPSPNTCVPLLFIGELYRMTLLGFHLLWWMHMCSNSHSIPPSSWLLLPSPHPVHHLTPPLPQRSQPCPSPAKVFIITPAPYSMLRTLCHLPTARDWFSLAIYPAPKIPFRVHPGDYFWFHLLEWDAKVENMLQKFYCCILSDNKLAKKRGGQGQAEGEADPPCCCSWGHG